jgi:hypothetical protein
MATNMTAFWSSMTGTSASSPPAFISASHRTSEAIVGSKLRPPRA